jgi:predicted HicB family RNase H-like nuclease
MMEYKGYIGKVEFDDSVNVFHGRVVNIRDVVTFEGTTVEELQREFHEAVDDYLEFCASRGEKPDKPFSGRFNVRLSPELHRQVAMAAAHEGESLNSYVSKSLERAVDAR